MRTILFANRKVQLRGLHRTLQPERLERALFNAQRRPGFMQKYVNPRSKRTVATVLAP